MKRRRNGNDPTVDHVMTDLEQLMVDAKRLLRTDPTAAIRITSSIASKAPKQEVDAIVVVEALLLKARAELQTGAYEVGRKDANTALTIAERFRLGEQIGKAHNELGVLSFVDNDFDAAMVHYDLALRALQPIKADAELARVYLNIGNVHHRRAEYATAIINYERVLDIAERQHDLLLQAKVLMNMAGFYSNILSDNDAAMRVGLRAAQIYEELGDKVGLGKAYSNLGFYFRAANDLATAIRLHEQALALRKEFAETDELLMNYHNLATTYMVADRMEDADKILREAESSDHMLTTRPGTYFVKLARGRLLCVRGQFEEGIHLIQEVKTWMEAHDLHGNLIEVHEVLAEAYELHGDLDASLKIYKKMFAERLREQRERAEHRLLHLKAKSELEHSKAQAETERIRSQQLAELVRHLELASKEKSEYLAFIAHELKNPIGNIRSIADLLVTDPSLTIEQRIEYDVQIYATATRMFDMVTNLLARARDHDMEHDVDVIDAVPIWRYVLSQWDTRTRDKSIILHTSFKVEDATVRASEQVLISILENLVSNAVKFSPPGRVVSVRVEYKVNDEDRNCVLLSITDQGPGLSDEDKRNLFAPFRTLSARPTYGEDSTGLGLHIVKRDVERIGGQIWCESAVGKGATFKVMIPISKPTDHPLA